MADAHTTKLRVYIDIDGTILHGPPRGDVPEGLAFQRVCIGLADFLEYVVENCEPYWLSYRTRLGYTAALEFDLFPHLPEAARTIPGAYWVNMKTEAIDPKRPFLWFDDDVESEDMEWLAKNNLSDSLVRMDHEGRDNPVLMLQHVKNKLGQV